MFLEKLGDGNFPELSLCDGEHGLEESFVRNPHFDAIESQEDQSRHDSDAFVAIHEGVVLDNVEEVGGCHFEKIGMQILSTMGRLRHGDGGVQQSHVADPSVASIPLDLISVDFDHLIQTEEDW